MNIIDYVRAKESSQPVIAPLRFAVGPANAVGDNQNKFTLHPSYTYGAANSYQGVCRAPYITEMGVYVERDAVLPPTPTPSGWPNGADGKPMKLYRAWFKSEIFLPENYGFHVSYPKLENQGIDLVPDLSVKPETGDPGVGSHGWFVTWTETRDQDVASYWSHSPNGQMQFTRDVRDPDRKKWKSHATNAVRVFQSDISGGEGPNSTVIKAGRRVVVTKLFYRDKSWTDRSNLTIRGVLFRGTSGSDGLLLAELNRWPRVNIGTQQGAIAYKISDPAKITIGDMVSIETDDPRCNVHASDWAPNVNGKNTLGQINSRSTFGKTPTKSPIGSPQQDTDDKGLISMHSLYMPPPKGVGLNDATHHNGRLTSIAELGYVHTGNNAKVGSTPWRTIRLQPNNYPDAKTLPDWAFMDLFTVPNTGVTGSDALFKPHGTALGGRVNVNSHVTPFDRMIRDRGLVCLLTGAQQLPTASDAKVIAENVYTRTLAPGTNKGKVYGYPWPASPTATIASNAPNAFDTPGEICEIKGVADGGEKSEDLMREVASLVTSRGGVFTVYTIGQALKQTPTGKLLVSAEQRQQAIIERYLDNKGTPDAGDDESRIRTVYFRNLTP